MTKDERIAVLERELIERRAKDGFYLRYGGYITFKSRDWNQVWERARDLSMDWHKVQILDGADRVICVILSGNRLKEYLEGE